jgi:hypothetical protein
MSSHPLQIVQALQPATPVSRDAPCNNHRRADDGVSRVLAGLALAIGIVGVILHVYLPPPWHASQPAHDA